MDVVGNGESNSCQIGIACFDPAQEENCLEQTKYNVYNFLMLLAMENQKAAEDSHNRENINSPLNNTSFIDQACLVEMAG